MLSPHSTLFRLVSFSLPATLVLALSGCDARSPAPTPAPSPNNSAVNARDRASSAVLPTDQGTNETDRRISAEIRQAIVADDSLSFDAKNCKIVTIDSKVTLRGPVANENERRVIETVARSVAGVSSVTNQLEVPPAK